MPSRSRRRHDRSAESGAAGQPAPGAGLGAEAAAAAEAAAEEEAAVWVEESGVAEPGVAEPGEPAGWFRDDALEDVPGTPSGAAPTVDRRAATRDDADAGADTHGPGAGAPVHPVEPGGEDAVAEVDAAGTEAADADAALPPGTIYRTVPPVPEDATPRPRRRSRVVSVLVGLLILVVVAAGGFGVGMLLPLLIPLPAVDGPVASAAPTGVGLPSATPGASIGSSPGATPTATASPRASVTPSPAATPLIYVVKRGDQLGRIARSFGVTLQAIEAANGITNPNLIIPGQKLVIPAPDASAGPSPSPGPSTTP